MSTTSVTQKPASPGARCATVAQIRELFKLHLGSTPCDLTIRKWLDDARVPRLKSNPSAKRGGGTVYYSVPHVEKMLRGRMLPGRLQPVETEAA